MAPGAENTHCTLSTLQSGTLRGKQSDTSTARQQDRKNHLKAVTCGQNFVNLRRRVVGRVRIYLADDHPIYRDGLAYAFRRRPDFDVIGESANGVTALDEIKHLNPDVAVLDVRLPDLSGIDLVKTIRNTQLGTPVVLVSAYSDSETIYDAIASGAAAYVHKGADRDQVCDTVAAVARGETRLAPMIQGRLLAGVQAHATYHEKTLTRREHEVLALTADGMSAPGIGDRLQLSPATVKSHLLHIYEKLGVSDRAAAVAEAMRRGLLR